MGTSSKLSWGLYPRINHNNVSHYSDKLLSKKNKDFYLAYGMGRSYGDVCLNEGNNLILSERLNKLIFFDKENGIIRAEAGISFHELLKVIVPFGYFLPVTPGTQFVTLGGAVANDVHGKNHHSAGTFGNFVTSIKLKRSNGKILNLSESDNKELFIATIGGLGLTGFILEVEFKLKAVNNHLIDVEYFPFSNLDEFFNISNDKEDKFEYTVAWLDCLSDGTKNNRGILICGNHASNSSSNINLKRGKLPLSVPFYFPSFVLNPLTMRVFNDVYFYIHKQKSKVTQIHYEPFFYPLDGVKNWNRIYGRKGFTQFQCVLPNSNNNEFMKELLKRVKKKNLGSFLTVLKQFGDIPSKGMLSFPREGATICLDFALGKPGVLQYVEELASFVTEAGGALYPAKDAVMTKEQFAKFFPELEEFKKYKDTNFTSSFWERVCG